MQVCLHSAATAIFVQKQTHMKNKIPTLSVLILMATKPILPDTLYGQTIERIDYQLAGKITIFDPKAEMTGYRDPGEGVFELSLDDVAQFTGHVCADISFGFVLTKKSTGNTLRIR